MSLVLLNKICYWWIKLSRSVGCRVCWQYLDRLNIFLLVRLILYLWIQMIESLLYFNNLIPKTQNISAHCGKPLWVKLYECQLITHHSNKFTSIHSIIRSRSVRPPSNTTPTSAPKRARLSTVVVVKLWTCILKVHKQMDERNLRPIMATL